MFYKIHDADKQMNIKHSSQVFHTLLHDDGDSDDDGDDGKRLVQQIQNHFCVLVRKKSNEIKQIPWHTLFKRTPPSLFDMEGLEIYFTGNCVTFDVGLY